MKFRNSTDLDTDTLQELILRHTAPYRHDRLTVSVRYSRGADFSGTCYYRHACIYVNIGRDVRYPYRMATEIAKARTERGFWWRETYYLILGDAYELALFVYMHELYHHLVKQAGRNPRRKEAMCDRFATQTLVDNHGCCILDPAGQPVPRDLWDFKDLHEFVSAAPKQPQVKIHMPRPIPVRIRGQVTTPTPRRAEAVAATMTRPQRGRPLGDKGTAPRHTPQQGLLFPL
ncbi:MAG: hypothetical protein JXO22_11855 [Phycisphaerae bacterium]|nr:hypothetical protein [Phycisphaerae bacterium]